jgi:hypothetical protein
MATFVQLFATWLEQRHAAELSDMLKGAFENEVEGATRQPSRDKLLKRVTGTLGETIVNRFTKGPEFLTWFDKVFEDVTLVVRRASYETIGFDRVYLETEDPFVVSGKYLGDQQDPDTEVPAYLSHNEITRVFTKMGGKARTDWSIHEVETNWGRDLRTVYSFRVTFPMGAALVSELFKPEIIGAAADAALQLYSEMRALIGNLQAILKS